MKISDFFLSEFSVFGGKIFSIFEYAYFRNANLHVCLGRKQSS